MSKWVNQPIPRSITYVPLRLPRKSTFCDSHCLSCWHWVWYHFLWESSDEHWLISFFLSHPLSLAWACQFQSGVLCGWILLTLSWGTTALILRSVVSDSEKLIEHSRSFPVVFHTHPFCICCHCSLHGCLSHLQMPQVPCLSAPKFSSWCITFLLECLLHSWSPI